VRELKVYCEIHPYIMPLASIKEFAPQAIILSGGPRSVYDRDAPSVDPDLFTLGVPILGICTASSSLTISWAARWPRPRPGNTVTKPSTISNFDDLFYGLNPKSRSG